MDTFNLPLSMAQFVDWEYDELSLSGSVTSKVPVTKNGFLPVKQVADTNYVSLSNPTRSGMEITVVCSLYTAGTLNIISESGNVYVKQADGTYSAASGVAVTSTGVAVRLFSVPIYISSTRTYRWCTDQDALSLSAALTTLDLPTYMAATANWEYAEPADAAAIPITKSGTVAFATGAVGETNTLANPTVAGQTMVLTCRSHGGGDRVITAAGAINQAGETIMTFGADRDTIFLCSIRTGASAFRWQVYSNDGVALS